MTSEQFFGVFTQEYFQKCFILNSLCLNVKVHSFWGNHHSRISLQHFIYVRSWKFSRKWWVVFHSLFTKDLIAIKNSLSCLNSCLSLNVSIKTSISLFIWRTFVRLVLDKKIGVGISVLKKSICFSDVVRCLPLRSSFWISFSFRFRFLHLKQ